MSAAAYRTVGKMIELLAGKAGVLTGNLQYGVSGNTTCCDSQPRADTSNANARLVSEGRKWKTCLDCSLRTDSTTVERTCSRLGSLGSRTKRIRTLARSIIRNSSIWLSTRCMLGRRKKMAQSLVLSVRDLTHLFSDVGVRVHCLPVNLPKVDQETVDYDSERWSVTGQCPLSRD